MLITFFVEPSPVLYFSNASVGTDFKANYTFLFWAQVVHDSNVDWFLYLRDSWFLVVFFLDLITCFVEPSPVLFSNASVKQILKKIILLVFIFKTIESRIKLALLWSRLFCFLLCKYETNLSMF